MEGGYDPVGVGPFAVGVRTLHLTDRVRGRRFPCELWYPADPDTIAAVDTGQEVRGEVRGAASVRDRVPLVLFSPLAGGDRRSSTFLCRHLAGHGYAVAALDHSEVVVPELAARPGESAAARQARVAAVIASRVPDLRFALAALLDERPAEAGDVGLDPMRVGVVGHSFGGWSALATPEQEPRVRAVVALAPAGATRPRPGILPVALSFRWRRDVPTEIVTGDEDVMTPLDGVTELFERAPQPKRMFVLRGADHLHFVDDVETAHESLRQATLPGETAWIPAAMRPLAQLCPPRQAHQTIRGLALAHLDATLRGNRRAEEFLERATSAAGGTYGVGAAPRRPTPGESE